MAIDNENFIAELREYIDKLVSFIGIKIPLDDNIDVEGLLKIINILLVIFEIKLNELRKSSVELRISVNLGLTDEENEYFIENIQNYFENLEYNIDEIDENLCSNEIEKIKKINESYGIDFNPPAM